MATKTFLNISKQECMTTYKRILNNSDNKWEAGKKLAEIKEFGGATSMAIISVEELVKSLVVLLDGQGFRFRKIKGMGILFKHHQIRYLLAFVMFVIGIIGDDLVRFLESLRNKTTKEVEVIMEHLISNKELLNQKIEEYALKKVAQIQIEFEWFSKIDIFRQDGFYCDYEEQLKDPIDISAEDYHQVISRLEKVREIGKIFITTLISTNETSQNHFLLLKKNLAEKQIYKKMEFALQHLKKTRENPFDVIRGRFTGLNKG